MDDRGRRKYFSLSLSLSVLAHASMIAIAICFVPSRVSPTVTMQTGEGGNGLDPGPILAPANVAASNAPSPDLQPPPASQSQKISVNAEPIESAISDSARSLILPETNDGEANAGAAGVSVSESVEQFPLASGGANRMEQSASASSGTGGPGADGLGGDGFAMIAPIAGARNRPPRYPADAQRRGLEGTVILRVHVLANGRISELQVVRSTGHEILDAAAVDAVRDWQFNPAIERGIPVACDVTQSFEFTLNRGRG